MIIKKSIGKFISTIYRHQSIILNQELEEFQLGTGQYIFLLKIFENEGINLKELSEIVQIDKANTTRAIKKLEKLSYIKLKTSQKDKRIQKIYLTEKGKEIIAPLRKKLFKITEIMARDFEEEEIDLLFNLLEKLTNNITDEVESRRNNKIKEIKNCISQIKNKK